MRTPWRLLRDLPEGATFGRTYADNSAYDTFFCATPRMTQEMAHAIP